MNQTTLTHLQAIAIEHGYVSTGEVTVHYPEGPITHYIFRHTVVRGVETLLLGIWQRKGAWYFDAHKSGSTGHYRPAHEMNRFLCAHVARAKRKLGKPGHCVVCGRDCTKKEWLKDSPAKYGGACSEHCADILSPLHRATS